MTMTRLGTDLRFEGSTPSNGCRQDADLHANIEVE